MKTLSDCFLTIVRRDLHLGWKLRVTSAVLPSSATCVSLTARCSNWCNHRLRGPLTDAFYPLFSRVCPRSSVG